LGHPLMGRYLKTELHTPRLDRILRWISRTGWVFLVSAVMINLKLFSPRPQIMLMSAAYCAMGSIIAAASVICIKKKYSPAKYGLIAFGSYMVVLTVFSLVVAGMVPFEFYHLVQVQQATSALGMVLLALGLADRINVLRKEKEAETQSAMESKLKFRDSQIRGQSLELELLKKTIQPRFIMNTLTALRSWLIEEPAKAVRLIDALADELRPIISNSDMKLIPLRDEIGLCRSHLTVMGLRLDRDYELTISGITGNETVPPLIFHTMVENAFTHCDPHIFSRFSLCRETFDGTTRYTFAVDARDNGKGPVREGTGMRYVRTRLDESYSQRWDMKSGFSSGLWCAVIDIREAES